MSSCAHKMLMRCSARSHNATIGGVRRHALRSLYLYGHATPMQTAAAYTVDLLLTARRIPSMNRPTPLSFPPLHRTSRCADARSVPQLTAHLPCLPSRSHLKM
eukprot:scaffold2653_cov111-Isochrysis_galbana.AAC.3